MKISTAGESHGKGLFCIMEGLPAGLVIDQKEIDAYLALRQSGYGRGARQKIEHDRAEILSGVRGGVTLGSPVTLAVWNRDYENWKEYMAPEGCDVSARRLTKVRPGHADLTGLKKFGGDDARNVLERASARETAVRVAAGTVCRQLLRALGVEVSGYVRSVGDVCDEKEYSFDALSSRLPELFMMDAAKQKEAMAYIDACREAGDTCGGVAELRVKGLKSGFGSCMTYAEKLDARLAAALMSVQAIKGVEVGLGFGAAARRGSDVHDEIFFSEGEYLRRTNRAGGIEGGMSNGEEIVLRAAMKPIPTLMRGLATVDYVTHEGVRAATERSDVCAILACEVVLECAVCAALAEVVLGRLGSDNLADLKKRYEELPL
ncbi:MAG TPA: chorismate synthase [Firmicutes bacterium]|nr:chorismate synthase [Bacillota bacterium]